jgi:hypothetical protein
MYKQNNYKEGLHEYIITNYIKSKIKLRMDDEICKSRKQNRKT